MKHPNATPPTDAGFWPRVGAKLIDHGLFAFVETALVGLAAWLNALGHPAWVIGSGFVLSTVLWYVYVFEMTRRRGQTLGKIVTGIRVVTPEGGPPTGAVMARRLAVEFAFDMATLVLMLVGWLVARGLAGPLQTWVVLGMAGLGAVIALVDPLAVWRTPRRQAIHDLAAGTFVLRVAERPVWSLLLVALHTAAGPVGLTFAVLRPLFVEAYVVPSGSMEPTIQIGDRILANKLVPRLRPPRHGEIIMFKAPEWVSAERRSFLSETAPTIFVKRVVGVPGDRLQVRDGKLLRNSAAVPEPYIKDPPDYSWPEGGGGQVDVPADSIVVMGDNRNNSNDSHRWTRLSADGRDQEPAPFLPQKAVRGHLIFRYWPPDRLGTVAQ